MQRYDIINWLIEKYGYRRYLEIGVGQGECFERVKGAHRTCVDPASDAVPWAFHCTSDEFFSDLPKVVEYDIIFIDGEHLEAQVMRDINNSLKHLANGGTIVVHDCNPPMANCAGAVPRVFVRGIDGTEHSIWNGTTWKAWVRVRLFRKDLEVRCVDTDWGCGIIRRGNWIPFDGQIYSEDATREHLTYPLMALERANYLNLITVKQFEEIYQ